MSIIYNDYIESYCINPSTFQKSNRIVIYKRHEYNNAYEKKKNILRNRLEKNCREKTSRLDVYKFLIFLKTRFLRYTKYTFLYTGRYGLRFH